MSTLTTAPGLTYPDGAYWTTALDCGHVPTAPTNFHANGVPLTAGRATDRDGRTMCYACADSAQAAEMSTAGTVTAYISGDGRNLTTWTGGVLARVTEHGHSARAGFGHGLHYWTVRDSDGATWHGRNGGPGMVVTVRRHRAPRRTGTTYIRNRGITG